MGGNGKTARVVVTFLLVTIGWVIFRASDIQQAVTYICRMLSPAVFSMPDLPKKTLFYAAECVVAIGFLIVMECKNRNLDFPFRMSFSSLCANRLGYVVISVWTFLFYSVGQTFIYFQF